MILMELLAQSFASTPGPGRGENDWPAPLAITGTTTRWQRSIEWALPVIIDLLEMRTENHCSPGSGIPAGLALASPRTST